VLNGFLNYESLALTSEAWQRSRSARGFEALQRGDQRQSAHVETGSVLLRVEVYGKSGGRRGVRVSGPVLGSGESETHSDGRAEGDSLHGQTSGATYALHAALRSCGHATQVSFQPVVNELPV
jgi:hypothetical protein